MRAVALVVAVASGLLLAGFGLLIWAAIPRSDTATSALLLFGLPFVLGGTAICGAAWVLLRRGRP